MEAQDDKAAQAQLWNGSAGQAWAALQALLDGMFAPFEPILAAAVRGTDRRILDVGCGAGATTLALARQAGAGAHCLGIDIAQPLIELARLRAAREGAQVDFARADAGSYPFEPAGMDLIVSRFGVMFFDDPVAAFTHLRRAARPGGRLDAIVWRSPDDNPFMTVAERAAQGLLPPLPARDPDAPGQFAFARRERVTRILEESGWQGIAIDTLDVACGFPAHELARYLSRMGPVGRLLEEMDKGARARVLPQLMRAFDVYLFGDEVRFTAACWRVRAGA